MLISLQQAAIENIRQKARIATKNNNNFELCYSLALFRRLVALDCLDAQDANVVEVAKVLVAKEEVFVQENVIHQKKTY